MTPEQEQAIAELRARHLAPKQIARQLGLRPAEVSAVLKAQAEQVTAARTAAGEMDPVSQCLVNRNCLATLLTTEVASNLNLLPFAGADKEQKEDMDTGFAVVTVARQPGFNRIVFCNYLVDIWCLGVKDASGPRKVAVEDYKDFIDYAYQPFEGGPVEIPLELAQAIVFGGAEYAAHLGFQPHRDFEKARPLLGEWSGQPALNFGRNGKPFYFVGPYDNPNKILKTLRETVGEGNFDYLIEAPL